MGGCEKVGSTCTYERMFDTPPDRTRLDAGDVDAWVEQLASSDGPVDDESRVEMLGALERLTCAAAGLQAEITARLDDSVRRGEAAQGIAKERAGAWGRGRGRARPSRVPPPRPASCRWRPASRCSSRCRTPRTRLALRATPALGTR